MGEKFLSERKDFFLDIVLVLRGCVENDSDLFAIRKHKIRAFSRSNNL